MIQRAGRQDATWRCARSSARRAATSSSCETTGARSFHRGRTSSSRSTTTSSASRGERGRSVLGGRHGRRHAPAGLHVRVRTRTRLSRSHGRSTEVEKSLNRIGLFLILVALGGVVIAAVLGLLVARAALTPVKRLTTTVERVTETQDLSERIDVDGQGRAEPARGELQHDARGARGVDPRAASARRGRVARAANAAHERAHEHRGARGRPNASAGGSRAGCSRTSSSSSAR